MPGQRRIDAEALRQMDSFLGAVVQGIAAQRNVNDGIRDYQRVAADAARKQFGGALPVGPWLYYEAMEQFEITNSRPQSTDDRNVEALQQEFPALDGSLVAAIYMDSKQMGAVREMLRELNGGS